MKDNDENELVRLPRDDDFALTPKIWLALGMLAYNHQLLTLKPLTVLRPFAEVKVVDEGIANAIRKGAAVLVDTEELGHDARAAFVQIARHLLEPLGMEIMERGAGPLPGPAGGAHERHHISVADIGGFAMRLREAPSPNPQEPTREPSRQSA